jgi:hypothetical protein
MDTALGMWYLHSRQPPVLHRDLKTPNLLIMHNWVVKVSVPKSKGGQGGINIGTKDLQFTICRNASGSPFSSKRIVSMYNILVAQNGPAHCTLRPILV